MAAGAERPGFATLVILNSASGGMKNLSYRSTSDWQFVSVLEITNMRSLLSSPMMTTIRRNLRLQWLPSGQAGGINPTTPQYAGR